MFLQCAQALTNSISSSRKKKQSNVVSKNIVGEGGSTIIYKLV